MINLYNLRPKGFNIGNDVIFLGLNHFIRMAFRENYNVISLPATSKYESHRKAGLNAGTVYEMNQFGHGLIIGGGNLYENGELEINPTALKALSIPSMIFSVSRGKVYDKTLELVDRTDVMTDRNIELLHDKVDISLSRDQATVDHLASIGCNSRMGACPTLFVNEMPQHHVPLTTEDKTDALISVRTPTLMSIPVAYQFQVRNHILGIIELLRKKGYQNIKLLCHDHRDIPFAHSIGEVDYLYTEDVYAFLTYLKNTRLNITYRLHSFLPCISYGTPVIKITYDQRAQSLIDSVGLDEWNINMLQEDVLTEVEQRVDHLGDLDHLVQQLAKERWPSIRNTLLQACNEFAAKAKAQHEQYG